MLETILVAVDASDQKHAVLFHAAEITRRFDAKLHVLSVYDLTQTAEARRFLSTMITAQASVMGFRESFIFVADISCVALLLVWCMRPKRPK